MASYNDFEDLTVLVTGGGGFVGGHLVEALNKGNEVRVLDDFSTGRRENIPNSVKVIQGDVRDETVVNEAIRNVDVVYHLAAQISIDHSVEAPRNSHHINVDGTLTVLEAVRRSDARIVLASSCAIYGTPNSVPIPESGPKEPISPYGLEKLTLDRYARMYNQLYDVPTVVVRPFNIYGPRQSGAYSGVINTFIQQARQGEDLTVHGDGKQTRDFVHVHDVVRAFIAAGTTDAVGEAFNVGTGESKTILELAETVRRVSGAEVDIVHAESRSGDIPKSRADISKPQDHLGYHPSITLEQGLKSLISQQS